MPETLLSPLPDPSMAPPVPPTGPTTVVALPTVNILGVTVHRVSFAQTLDQIGAWIAAPSAPASSCRQICTVNPEFIIDANRDPLFAAALGRADLRVPDGVGILWAARLLGVPLQERVTGSDGIYLICERAAREGWRVFLLGAAPGVAEHAAQLLMAQYKGLVVVGSYAGSPSDHEWIDIRERLATAEPDILFVAYGHPRQDLWIDAHRHELPTKVAMGIGGALDFVTGVAQRAPLWMQRLGLEWLHRLIRQPWRWRRMAKLPIFVVRVLGQRAKRAF